MEDEDLQTKMKELMIERGFKKTIDDTIIDDDALNEFITKHSN